MTRINDQEWDAIEDGLDTAGLLDTVDAVDRLRAELASGELGEPPQIRDDLLRLHQLALLVRERRSEADAVELFDLSTDLDLLVGELMDALGEIQSAISAVSALYPESLSYEDVGGL